MIRLSDKWSRLESFCKQDELKVKDESVEDTLMDNAVYSLIAILLRREESLEAKRLPKLWRCEKHNTGGEEGTPCWQCKNEKERDENSQG